MDCLFCKMVKGDIPITKVYENEFVLAFNDINPQAPVHILLIPKAHFSDIHKVDNKNIHGELMSAVSEIVKQENLIENGYRVVINSGKNGGQEVKHLHYHILGGRSLQWPPG